MYKRGIYERQQLLFPADELIQYSPKARFLAQHLKSAAYFETRRLKRADVERKLGPGICEHCRRSSFWLEVHHLFYGNVPHELLGDLMLLCPKCHRFFHGIQSGPAFAREALLSQEIGLETRELFFGPEAQEAGSPHLDLLEPTGAHLGIPDSVLDVSVPEPLLNVAGGNHSLGHVEPARVTEHMGMDPRAQAGLDAGPLDDGMETALRHPLAALIGEDRAGLLDPELSQRGDLVGLHCVSRIFRSLGAADRYGSIIHVNLMPIEH
jgi:hypothetical protein